MKPISTAPNPFYPGLVTAPRVLIALVRRAVAPLIGLLAPLLIAVLWYVAAREQWMAPQILPTPGRVLQTAQDMLASGELLSNLAVSLRRLMFGLAAGVAAGVLLGAAMGVNRRVDALLRPTFSALVQVPTLAWIPLFMLCFGIGETLKLVVIIKAVLVPVTLHTRTGVRDVPPALRELSLVCGLSRWQCLRCLVLPAALPAFLIGLRLALSQAWLSLIVVELLASSEGIGYLMVNGRQLFQLDIVLVGIVVIGLVGLLMDRALQWLERTMLRWPRPSLAAYADSERASSGLGWLPPLLLLLLLLLLWQTASSAGWVSCHVLSTPLDVVHAFIAHMRDASLPQAWGASLLRDLVGLLLGGLAGFAAGLATGLWGPIERLFGPSLAALRQVAIFAWIPILTAWVGIGEASKISFVALSVFFPMLVATHSGMRNLSPALQEVAAVVGLNSRQRIFLLLLPGAAPAIFAGIHVSLVYGWIGTIGAEYFMSSGPGIGSYMINAEQMFQMEIVLSAMLLIGLTGVLLNLLGTRLENRYTAWRKIGIQA